MSLTLFCRHSSQIEHLELEILWLREQLVHERQRAEVGTDRLLATRGIGPITLPTPNETQARDDALRALMANDDFQRAGEVT